MGEDVPKLGAEVARGVGSTMSAPHSRIGAPPPHSPALKALSGGFGKRMNTVREKGGLMRVGL